MIEPLTPPDLDLRDFQYMPLDVVRLRDSDIAVIATGDEFRAAVMLWCASWHQIPAASLPNDEKLLANLAGFGRDLRSWRAVSDVALRGFILCDDGRLYHPVIADKAIEASSKRRRQRQQTKAATEARRKSETIRDVHRNDQRNDQHDNIRNDDRDDAAEPERNVHQGKGMEEKGIDDGGVETPAREPSKSMISPEAFEITGEILKSMGKTPDDPLAVGGPYTVQHWLSGGVSRDAIMFGVSNAMARKKHDPPSTFNYFEKAVLRAAAELNRPLPKVEIQEPDKVAVRGGAVPRQERVTNGFATRLARRRREEDEHAGHTIIDVTPNQPGRSDQPDEGYELVGGERFDPSVAG